jgi:hypothetical protein
MLHTFYTYAIVSRFFNGRLKSLRRNVHLLFYAIVDEKMVFL